MIEKTKCRSCGQAYEIIWNDVDVDSWRDDFEEEEEYSEEASEDPVYCPFCGTHADYSE